MQNHGISLECLLSYKQVNIGFIQDCVNILNNYGFYLRKDEEIVIVSDEFEIITYEKLLKENLGFVKAKSVPNIILNFRGELYDVDTDLSISVNKKNEVVTISIPEKVIWAYYPEFMKPDINRFMFFVNICKKICYMYPPMFAFIGEESYDSEDFSINNLKNNNIIEAYNESFFSEENLRTLFSAIL